MTLELPTQWDSQTSEEILSMGLTPYHPDYSVRFRWLLLLKVRLSSWEDCLIRCLTLCQHLLFLSHISVCQLWDSSLDAHLRAQNLLPFWLYSLLVPKSFCCKIQKSQNNSLAVQIHQSSRRTSVVSRQTVSCSPSMHWLPAAFYLLVPWVLGGSLLDISTHVLHIDF